MPCGSPTLHQTDVNGRRITYELHRSPRRRKTITLAVEGERIRILAPLRTPQPLIEAFIQQRGEWIVTRLVNVSPTGLQAELRDGGSLPLLGVRYPVGASFTPFEFDGEQFLVDVDRPDRAAFAEAWLREFARDHFNSRVDHWSPTVGAQPKRIQIRNQKTRWGSASAKGTLSFNWRLIFAPTPIVDYVVVHELCHLIHPNHGADYWRLVESCLPDYRARRRELKQAADSLNW